MAFVNTLREGLESVVFLTGVSAGTDPRSIPLAGVVGIILGVLVGVILYYTCAPLSCRPPGALCSYMTCMASASAGSAALQRNLGVSEMVLCVFCLFVQCTTASNAEEPRGFQEQCITAVRAEGAVMACRGKSISDIGWFLIIMSVLLLFIGAGALCYCCSPQLVP